MLNSDSIDLGGDSLEKLHEKASWAQLSAAVRRIDRWDESLAAKLDDLYRLRLIRTLRSRAAADEIAEFSAHLALAAHDLSREALSELSRPYFDRWRAWGDLLATRHQMLSVPGWLEASLRNTSKAEILYLVCASGGIALDRLKKHFEGRFSAPYLTRLLNELEANLLIERQRIAGNARHKQVFAGSDAPTVAELEKFLAPETIARCQSFLAPPPVVAKPVLELVHGPRRQQPGLGHFLLKAA